MSFLSLLYSFILGAGAGALYGSSFLSRKNAILGVAKNFSPRGRSFFVFIFHSLLRLGLFGLFWWYILLTPSLSIILVLTSFLGSFWITVLTQQKVYQR